MRKRIIRVAALLFLVTMCITDISVFAAEENLPHVASEIQNVNLNVDKTEY